MSKNFIFISPTFPPNYYQFPLAWKEIGGCALCIGEDHYDSLSEEFKNSCDEYYQVNSLHNYDEMYRAVAWFAHKHGKIDWLESNNEYWLEQDARLRTDFNIQSGDKEEDVLRYRYKSNMKAFYKKAGVPTARYHLVSTLEKGKAFVKEVGYPLIVKPDDGMGANATWKINNDSELEEFYALELNTQYIMEEYIEGYIVSFDGLTDQNGEIIYRTCHVFPETIMEIVNEKQECVYYSEKEVTDDLEKMGSAVIKAFNIKGRFFHTEYFRLTSDKKGVGKKGDLVGLEVNMRPPGGYTPDMMNFASDFNIYSIYAEMAMHNTHFNIKDAKYHVAYVGRRDGVKYKFDEERILKKFNKNIVMHDRMPEAISDALGNEFYVARFENKEKMNSFIQYILERKGAKKK